MKSLNYHDILKLKKELQEKKRTIDERLLALDIMLKWFDEDEAEKVATENQSGGSKKYSNMGLAEACLHIINNSDKVYTAREVLNNVKSGGFPFKAARPDASVASTLRRLAKEDRISMVKTQKGVFYKRIVKEANN